MINPRKPNLLMQPQFLWLAWVVDYYVDNAFRF